MPVKYFGALHQGLGKRRMRVHGLSEIERRSTHLDREDPFADQLTRSGAYDADAQNTLRVGIDDKLRDAVGSLSSRSEKHTS